MKHRAISGIVIVIRWLLLLLLFALTTHLQSVSDENATLDAFWDYFLLQEVKRCTMKQFVRVTRSLLQRRY